MTTGKFVFEWTNAAQPSGDRSHERTDKANCLRLDTEIFVPNLISRDRKLLVKGLGPEDRYHHDESRQTLYITASAPKRHKIVVTLDPPLRPAFRVNSFWGDFGPRLFVLSACLVGLVAYLLHSGSKLPV
jgi:hypothetical protein